MNWVEETVERLEVNELVQSTIEMAEYARLAATDPRFYPFLLGKAAELHELLLPKVSDKGTNSYA